MCVSTESISGNEHIGDFRNYENRPWER